MSNYGNLYWGVKTGLSEDGEIYLHADSMEVTPTGDVVFYQHKGGKAKVVMLAVAAGHWTGVYAASVANGNPVAVEHWKGEVRNR